MSQPPLVDETAYDAYYYRNCCGSPYLRNEMWLAFSARIADRILRDIRPRRVLDAGCGLGLLVETLRDRGVDAYGVDVSSYVIGQVYEPIRPFCSQGSITEEFQGRYDLIVSIEVLEHMPPAEAERAVENMCAHTDEVLFSSTPIDYKEPTHVNVRQPDYWVEQFGRYGFFRDVDFDGSVITPWAIRFRRSTEPPHRIVRGYERRLWELVAERNDLRTQNLQLQEQLKAAAELARPGRRLWRRITGRVKRTLTGRSGG